MNCLDQFQKRASLIVAMVGLIVVASVPLNDVSAQEMKKSVLLEKWSGPHGGVPPWKSVKPKEFVGAFDRAFEMATADIEKITSNAEAATFENTIVAMEKAGETLNRVETLFGVHASNLNVGVIPDIEGDIAKKSSAHSDSIMQNKKLFERIAAVYDGDELKAMGTAEKRLVEKYYKNFVRNGAKLNEDDKKKLADYNKQLAGLFTQFSQNVLHDEGKLYTPIESEDSLKGLPKSLVAAMEGLAKERAEDGVTAKWIIANTRSSMEPYLTYAEDRAMREKVWRQYYSRGDNGDKYDNNEIIAAILKLRAERAVLLGYKTHAHRQIEPAMAKVPENAMALMMKVWPKAVARVKEEVKDMQDIADKEGAGIKIEPWDYRFYAEKVRLAKYDLDSNEVKEYLQLDKLREGMMWASTQVYGFEYNEIKNVPTFHPDVRVFEVTKDGKHIGLWYFDPYARQGKRSGAWMNAYRIQRNLGEAITPIVSNNSNFVKTDTGEPVLISWDDATTLFHEFGHALHGLNSKCKYPSQAGTSVSRDYVEFPSQVNEHWLPTKEVLKKFAVHYKTGEPMPAELLAKIEKAATFNQGFSTVEYLASALVDMKLHLAGNVLIDPDKFERETLVELGMPSEIVMRHRTPQFNHLFSSDGYSAGYYSYLWSDALTADAAEAFEEAGSYYDKEVSKRLHDYIFSVGDTIDPAEGFRRFRGRDVDTRALLRKRGFPVDEE